MIEFSFLLPLESKSANAKKKLLIIETKNMYFNLSTFRPEVDDVGIP